MNIASFIFLVFLLGVCLVFFLCPVKYRWIILLAGSLVFYWLSAGWKALIPLTVTTVIVWGCGILIGRIYEGQEKTIREDNPDKEAVRTLKKTNKKKARGLLIAALVLIIGILVFMKFSRFLDREINALFRAAGTGFRLNLKTLLVPLGISYYTFSTASYLLDVYWGRIGYEKNFFRFFLFAVYFPHIVQGPISRYQTLGQELKKELRYSRENLIFGLQLMVWGFFKKLVIADRMAIFMGNVYNNAAHPGSIFLLAMLMDALMLYADFSGYMDIVTGTSRIFGVSLEQNFNHPFFSRTIGEFWRRWHMSMGAWFRDYVYTPLTVSGPMKKLNRFSRKRLPSGWSRFFAVLIPVMITWVLTGLWHGTGKTYLLWGVYYGTLITLSQLLEPFFEKAREKLRIDPESRGWRIFSVVRTFCIFMGGRLLVSPGTLKATGVVIRNVLTNFQPWRWFDNSVYRYGLDRRQFGVLIVSVLVMWTVSLLQQKGSLRERLAAKPLVLRWIIIYAAIFAVLIYGIYGPGYNAADFIYTQF